MASFSSTEQPRETTQATTAFSDKTPPSSSLQLHIPTAINLQSQASSAIIQSVRQCCSEQLKSRSVLDVFEPWTANIPEHPRRYWEDIKHAIYIIKSKSTSVCGIKLWESADEMVLHGISYDSFDFVWELFAVLSPANTTACPELRQASLRYLRALTATKLHPTHPVTKMCGLLLQNSHDFQLCEIGLLEAWNIFGSRLGYEHQTACRLQRMLVSTARRLGNLTEAERRARALYNHACTSRMDSYLSRSCARSLSHVLISSYQYDEAREVCKSIVDSLQSPAGSAMDDERAIQAMEDLADIELRLGNIGQSLWYLQRANDAGRRLWPGSVASAQMEEKLGWDIYAPKIPVVC
ncbi:hypothetical protein CCHR01_11991 [Colletotrichum chrysophilum]|uniref:Uncharacterized protein n=1 Tax=Colletotrichum chrysophilum TaxID=1836956 RepID=A0AAD9AGY0_9PEZI|nr:hypothetical protein CCHR01_11991 [Colletotrichum chrysophilum]